MRKTKHRIALHFLVTGLLLAALLLCAGCGGSNVLSSDPMPGKTAMKKPDNPGKPPPEPASPEIVYMSRGIRVMDADGSNPTAVVGFGEDPCWSPDGLQIAFHTTGDQYLYTVNVDGSNLQEILSFDFVGAVEEPAWSPAPVPDRGFRIAFAGRPLSGADRELGLVDCTGSGLEYVTNTPDVSESWPTWSPDATKLAYTTYWHDDATGKSYMDIYVLDLTTGVTARVDIGGPFSSRVINLDCLDWARTQDKIALAGATSTPAEGDPAANAFEIWVVDLNDPTNPTQLTNDPGAPFASPSWSPDDSEIVYHKGNLMASADRGSEIWKMNADGSGKTLLQSKPAAKWPDWKR